MKTVEKTLDILETFLKQEGEIGITELANLNGLNISTAYRIAFTLVNRGYLNQQQRRGKYSLSPKLLQFGSIIKKGMKIGDVAFPFLERLNKMVDESVNLAILDTDEVTYIEHIEPSHNLRMFTQVGNRLPLHCTGMGKVFLAQMNDNDLKRYLNSKGLPYRTENTITDSSKLKEELVIIKREDIATDDGETEPGVKCVASPVKDSDGNVIAAISVSGPSARLNSERIREIKLLVKSCALEISRATGYGGE